VRDEAKQPPSETFNGNERSNVKSLKHYLSGLNLGLRTDGVTERVLSVDALRGFDMFWIIGGQKIFRNLDEVFHSPTTQWIDTQLDHAAWFGFTLYDIIMPLFLYLVGISMVFSFNKRLSKDPSRANLWKHILIRLFWLWVLGMMVQGKLLTYDIAQIKLYSNTLQAIAAGYLIASVFVLYLTTVRQFIATAGLLVLYWAVFTLVPVPGIGAGLFEPEANMALFIDKAILGSFQDGTTYTWILSSLGFGATTMLGVFTGYLLQTKKTGKEKLVALIASGTTLVILGKIWEIWHPLIKHIWTGSFVLYSGGICLLLLAAFFYLIEVRGYKKWSVGFIVIGSNAIAAYVSSHIFDFRLVAKVFVGGLKPYIGDWYSSVLALGGFIVLYLILKYMHKNKVFVKI
jgi:predicted acyltransferase